LVFAAAEDIEQVTYKPARLRGCAAATLGGGSLASGVRRIRYKGGESA
jgi:hypothetical protein